ncbi:MAG: hypothetical protein KDC00_10100 [Flavobacteriales bacterium]|nr:hypothetical protein [Flavobacteriales bacterium]
MVLLVLAWFAWTYFLERTACFDSAFFSWLMIDSGEPVSVLGRYGSWVAQLLPVALIRSGASLEVVLRSYSLTFIVFHALVFALLAFVLKDRKATYALPIVLTAGFHYMFYYGISELYQGLTLTLLLWAILKKALAAEKGSGLWKWVVLAILLNVWISFYHQLLLLPLIFMVVFEAIPNNTNRRRLIRLGTVLVLWYVVRIKAMATSTYEESRMPKVEDLIHYSKDLGGLNSTVYLCMVWTKFKALLILGGAAVAMAIHGRKWLRLLWTILFSIGFMVLVLVVDRDGMSPIIYENYYPVLGLFWVMLLVSSPSMGTERVSLIHTGLLVLVCGVGLIQIHRGHFRLSEKVAYAKRITDHQAMHGSKKSIVGFHNYPWTYALGHWAAGMETALASAIDGPDKAATIFVSEDMAFIDTARTGKEQFLGPAWSPIWFGLPSLDERYFQFPTDSGYQYANTWVHDFPFASVVITPRERSFRLVPDRYSVVLLDVRNTSVVRAPSLSEAGTPCRFKYTLHEQDGTVYQESSVLSDMEADIPPGASMTQGLVIERPVDNGTYIVRARLEFGPDQVVDIPDFQVVADRWPF